MSYVALSPPPSEPATPAVPAFQFFHVTGLSGGGEIKIYPGGGPFTVDDYAKAAGIDVDTAQAVLDQALADGKIAAA